MSQTEKPQFDKDIESLVTTYLAEYNEGSGEWWGYDTTVDVPTFISKLKALMKPPPKKKGSGDGQLAK